MRTQRLMELEILTTALPAMLLLLLVQHGQMVESFGYSYSRFIGPVRGPERQIIVHDRHDGRGRVDYVARPEYHFAYGVEDAKTRVLQNRRETRNGDAVKGVYSVVDPDGSLRVVKYTADNVNGFQAEVVSNGVSRIHGHDNPVVHPPVAVGNNQVIGKDNSGLYHRQHQHSEVQHPAEEDVNVHEEAGGDTKSQGKNENENDDDDDDTDDSAAVSDPKDTSDYEDKDDGGSEESSEEVEDY